EARPDGAADERVAARRSGRLPDVRGYDVHRLQPVAGPPKYLPSDVFEVCFRGDQLERITFVVVPDLVRCNAVPAAYLAGGKQEVDGREGGTVGSRIERLHARRGSVDLAVVASLRMRGQRERCDQIDGTGVHGGPRTSLSLSCAACIPEGI